MNGRIKRFKAYNEVTRKRWKSYKQQMYPIVIRRNYLYNSKSKTQSLLAVTFSYLISV